MARPKVFFVHLRRPVKSDPKEQRADPFYEFGSFGCTGCHSTNLLHPRNAAKLQGARFAFVQGGMDGSRLVFLTPRVTVTVHDNSGKRNRNDICEVNWKPEGMPFKYAEAPILIRNDGYSDFRTIKRFARSAKNCPTLESGLSSLLRSRSRQVSDEMASDIVHVYKEMRRWASSDMIAEKYYEALPYEPSKIDDNRTNTYARLVTELTVGSHSRCRKPPCREPGD